MIHVCIKVEEKIASIKIGKQISYSLWSLEGNMWYAIMQETEDGTHLRGTIKGYPDRQAIGRFLETVAELM